jgi:GT2 family glycosyltransferase
LLIVERRVNHAAMPLAQPTGTPELSVILSTPGEFGAIKKTLSHLAAQTALARMELVIVASSVAVLQPDAGTLAAFPRHRILEIGDFGPLGAANAAGVRAASAPVIVLAEDHCFPNPDWAEHLLRAHKGPWAAIGPAVRNANPSTLISWADLFIGYGPWLEPVDERDVEFLPGHNTSYKREILLAFGDRLETLLNVETVLHWELRSQGYRLRLEPAARVAHTNFSLWSSWLPVSFLNGRTFAAERRKGMSVPVRVAYVVGAPLIPFVRAARTAGSARTQELRRQFLLCLPAMLIGLGADALGQMVGYAIGAGASGGMLSRYECHRVRHVTARDRREVFAE